MIANLQHYFRFYLALFLVGLLAVGVRMQAAPLGAKQVVQDQSSETISASKFLHG